MTDGIVIVDIHGNVSLINKSAYDLFEIQKMEVVGNSLAQTLRNHNVNSLLERCTTSGKLEISTFETSQNKQYIRCVATPLKPKIKGSILFLFQNLTRIRQLEMVRRDFVSNVSHELRTPLTSIKLITETLQEGAINDPPVSDHFLNQMDREVDNLTQIVEELLELSRIESGRVPLNKKWVKPSDLIQLAGERMRMQADNAGLDFTFLFDESIPKIFIDETRLSRVLINLIHNAIKFTPPGGNITVSARNNSTDVIFSVEDSGIGIPQKDQERIFERFYKSDPSRSNRGTGLGLSIARHLVEIHGGKLWVESNQGKGSKFQFSIPINS